MSITMTDPAYTSVSHFGMFPIPPREPEQVSPFAYAHEPQTLPFSPGLWAPYVERGQLVNEVA